MLIATLFIVGAVLLGRCLFFADDDPMHDHIEQFLRHRKGMAVEMRYLGLMYKLGVHK